MRGLRMRQVPAGSVVLFDYRVLHRGRAHAGAEPRPVLYFTYARRWFSDNLNFPTRSAPPHLAGSSADSAADSAASAAAAAAAAGQSACLGAGQSECLGARARVGFPALAAADAAGAEASAAASTTGGTGGAMYLDGPGGTQVHGSVVDAVSHALVSVAP